MKIDKGDISLNVSQMSDGEKCTLALLGDLARRLTLANPNKSDPLSGEGIVLIDEVELHMHPSWQRKILNVLRHVFPNIQFIITTHSPIVLSGANENYNLFFTENEDGKFSIQKNQQLNDYDADAVLEQFMDTKSMNEDMLNPACEDTFTYYANGMIEGDEYTIGLLNLNAYELREARRAVYRQLQELDRETIKLVYMNMEDESLPAYYNVIKWFVNHWQ